jgi:hypothetical protein
VRIVGSHRARRCFLRALAAYGKPVKLSAVDFTSDEGDAWIGWGFMPKSVKNTLYPKGYKGMFNK